MKKLFPLSAILAVLAGCGSSSGSTDAASSTPASTSAAPAALSAAPPVAANAPTAQTPGGKSAADAADGAGK